MIKLFIVVPAYNEHLLIGQMLDEIQATFTNKKSGEIIVVDDGSHDKTGLIAAHKGAVVIKHAINLGLGAALATGFQYALNNGCDYLITIDADKQHQAEDIWRLLDPLKANQADVVIGSRLLSKEKMPLLRKVINYLSNLFTFFLYGVWTSDSQSGLRGFNKKALQKIHLQSQRMEVSSEIIGEIKRHGLRLAEIPIRPIYTTYSLNKGQRILNAPNVFWKLILQRFM